jgi:hypothetical protein
MSSTKVEIKELRVRVPSMQRAQARQLGELVAERLAEQPLTADQQSHLIPRVNTSVRSRSLSSVDAIASEIVDSIRRTLAGRRG